MGSQHLFRDADKNRINHHDSFWNDKKRKFAVAVGASFILIQLLFIGLMSYLSGAVYKDSTRVHNFNVLMVDYDGGVLGESMRQASASLSSPKFPTIQEKSVADYPTQQDLVNAVWDGTYWGAVFVAPNASQHLSNALVSPDAAKTYNSSNVMTFVYNGARYSSFETGFIAGNLQTLISVSRTAYNQINGTAAFAMVNRTSTPSVQALLNPIRASSIDVKPSPQGTRVLYNTVFLVMPIVMQFFFIMAVNGVSEHFNVYSHLPLRDNGIIRLGLALCYTFVGALCTAGYEAAFYENDWLSASQFAQAWMTYWLYMHINFMAIDCLTAFVPVSALPFLFFGWVMFNTTSVVLPFELSPAFYRWGYALPSHEILQVLITVWTSGGADSLSIALPILFAWEVILIPLSVLGLRYRCANAAKAFNENETAMQEKYGYHVSVTDAASSEDSKIIKRTVSTASVAQPQDVVTMGGAASSSAGNGYFPSTPLPLQATLERVMTHRIEP